MKRIAVIEDNPDNRLLVEAILDELYELNEYEDGILGLDGLRSERPDLVLLDISLPGMDGVAVLAEIRGDEELKSLPVIALTAHAMAGDEESFLEKGFDAYVSKPIVDEDVLIATIEELLNR
ncbi:MAG: response regulator [Myxococcota bacterium]|nr:response regulator [Myxococcota bacterium]